MERGGIGLTEALTPSLPLSGHSSESTAMLDFDDMPFKKVKYWAARAMKWFNLEGLIIELPSGPTNLNTQANSTESSNTENIEKAKNYLFTSRAPEAL